MESSIQLFLLCYKLTGRDGESGPGTRISFLPGPGTKCFWTGPGPKCFFWTGTVTKIFLTGTGTKICFWRDQNRDLKLLSAGTGTKNDWSRSCLLTGFSFKAMSVEMGIHWHYIQTSRYTASCWRLAPALF
jgi:hypothetical protein